MDFNTAFDLFIDCYAYGSIAYISLLLIIHLILSFLSLVDEYQATDNEFYDQVKELLNPATEEVFELHTFPCFDTMTIRELRAHIKENHLQQHVRDCLGKTVSNARKSELIQALS